MDNGLHSEDLKNIKALCKETGKLFVWNEEEDRDENFASFFFTAEVDGKETVVDAFMYTLETEYASLTFDIAKDMVLNEHPSFADLDFDQEDGEHIDKLELAMVEVEEEGLAKVSEFMEEDEVDGGGIVLTVCLNVPEVNEYRIDKFINAYRKGEVELDGTLYSFEPEDEEGEF